MFHNCIFFLCLSFLILPQVAYSEKQETDQPSKYLNYSRNEKIDEIIWIKSEFTDSTIYQNQTYLISPSTLLHSPLMKQSSFVHNRIQLSMELHGNRDVFESVQIVFAVSIKHALNMNSNLSTFESDFIDRDGFYLRKKYFRIDLTTEFLIFAVENGHPIYLTIFQNVFSQKAIQYSISYNFISQSTCPFNCLNKGKCIDLLNICSCQAGYFDAECSRYANNLNAFGVKSNSSEASTDPLEFIARLNKSMKSIFFYKDSIQKSNNSIFLSIEKIPDLIKEKDCELNLLIFFSVFSDQSRSKPSLASSRYSVPLYDIINSQIEIQLGKLQESKIDSNTNRILSRESTFYESNNNFSMNQEYSLFENQLIQQLAGKLSQTDSSIIQYTLGFFLEGEISDEDITFKLRIEEREKNSPTTSVFKIPLYVIILLLIVLVIGVILIIFLIYLRKRTQAFDRRLLKIQSKKLKKEEEQREILDLLPVFVFSEELKVQLKLEQSDDQEEPMCSVCLCEFEISEEMRKTYCPHYFHSECLQSWLEKQKNCPHCRNCLTAKSIQSKNQPIKQLIPSQKQQQTTGYQEQIDEPSGNMFLDYQEGIQFSSIKSDIADKKETKLKLNRLMTNTPIKVSRRIDMLSISAFEQASPDLNCTAKLEMQVTGRVSMKDVTDLAGVEMNKISSMSLPTIEGEATRKHLMKRDSILSNNMLDSQQLMISRNSENKRKLSNKLGSSIRFTKSNSFGQKNEDTIFPSPQKDN